jgi:hypothetical protein
VKQEIREKMEKGVCVYVKFIYVRKKRELRTQNYNNVFTASL